MGANRKRISCSASASIPGATDSSGWIKQTVSNRVHHYDHHYDHHYESMEPTIVGGFNNNFQFEGPPLIHPLVRRDSLWTDGGSGTLPVGTGSTCCIGDNFPDFEVADLSHGAPQLSLSDTISSMTYSPASSYQGSVWSPIQTDIASGASRSRVPSPLRHMARIVDVEGENIYPKNSCGVESSSKKDLEFYSEIGHLHACLWGDNGPCDSAGFATREELNWHVKSEHLLLCPIPGCTEGAFLTRDFLDCHMRCAHSNTTTDKNIDCRLTNLNGAAAAPLRPSAASSQASATQAGSVEDKGLKVEMTISNSKRRCRGKLIAVLEKKMRRTIGGTPKADENHGMVRSRTLTLLESASFPIIWEHGVLPFLVEFIPKWCGPGHVISVMRGREPHARQICIMTKQAVSIARRLVIAGHVRDVLPGKHRSLVTFVFCTGTVDRLVWSRGWSKDMPDEICPPRNPFCYISPCMGDSIGTTLEDGDQITATLGPCVTIGGGNYWLANFHPFVEASKGTRPLPIEHPSPMDRARCRAERHDASNNGDAIFQVGNLTATSGYDLKTTRVSHDLYWEDCDKEPPLVVTDWALISAKTQQANLLRKSPTTSQRQEMPVTSMSSIVPGAAVCATGRTSGFQRGQVCEIPAYLDGAENGTGKASREWYIEEPYPYDNEGTDEERWIRGGIGVEGDSGAAIIDCESNAIVGQLWGRNKYYGPGPRFAYFTPIFDIFDDIQEKCGQEGRPQLPQFRDEADCWPVYPLCRQCFDLREYLESRRSSRESLMSMIGIHDGRAGDIDNDLTSVSELETPKDHTYLIRHIGPDDAQSSIGGIVSPPPVHSFYSISHALSPENTDMRSPYAQALNDEDLYEKHLDTNEVALGKRPALPTPMARSGSKQLTKRRRVM